MLRAKSKPIKPGQFKRLATSIYRNAATYRNQNVCRMMATKLKKAYDAAGGYGAEWNIYRDALWEIQLRAIALYSESLDDKYGSISAERQE